MLELLYATGLRVSELVGLQLSNVNLRQGVVRVLGKGSKERIVPVGATALNWIEKYLIDARPYLLEGAQTGILFPSNRKQQMTRQTFLVRNTTICSESWNSKTPVAPHVASRVCNALAEPWR